MKLLLFKSHFRDFSYICISGVYQVSLYIYKDLQNKLAIRNDKAITSHACRKTNPYCAYTMTTCKLAAHVNVAVLVVRGYITVVLLGNKTFP